MGRQALSGECKIFDVYGAMKIRKSDQTNS